MRARHDKIKYSIKSNVIKKLNYISQINLKVKLNFFDECEFEDKKNILFFSFIGDFIH